MREHGTNPLDMSPWTRDVINAELGAILERHRRMAHRAWVRAIRDEDDEPGACRAWMCARLHCGMRKDA